MYFVNVNKMLHHIKFQSKNVIYLQNDVQKSWGHCFSFHPCISKCSVWCAHESVCVCVSLWVCEVGKCPKLQGHGNISVSMPLGCHDMRRWGQDALSHTGGLQQRPQLLTSRYYGNKVIFIRTPGNWPASGDRSQFGEEQRYPRRDINTHLLCIS